jgi:hypothetical protein
MRISRKDRPQAAAQQPRCGATDRGSAGSECILPPHAYGDHADALGLSYDNDADGFHTGAGTGCCAACDAAYAKGGDI